MMAEESHAGPVDDAATGVHWASLLAKWTEFAQASVALPKDDHGERWRRAVPSIIALQAATMALRDLDELQNIEERPVAIDRAGVIIRQHSAELGLIWTIEGAALPLHDELNRLIGEAQRALESAVESGYEWRVGVDRLIAGHPGELVESLLGAGFEGDLFVPTPGAPLFKRSPAAFARGLRGGPLKDDVLRAVTRFLAEEVGKAGVIGPNRIGRFRQVYRQYDFSVGRPSRDLIITQRHEQHSGQPMLVAAIRRGSAVSVTLPIRGWSEQEAVPVIDENDDTK